MLKTALHKHAEIGLPTCSVGKQLTGAECFVTTAGGPFSVAGMLSRRLPRPFEAGFEQGGITARDFSIRLRNNTVLLPGRILGEGTFGTVYEFTGDGLQAAVKFRWVLDYQEEDLAQSAFDLRQFEAADHQEIVAIQQSLGCNAVFSVHFSTDSERVRTGSRRPVVARLDVVLMEFSPTTLYSFLGRSVIPHPSPWYRTEVVSGLAAMLCSLFSCAIRHRTVFPDIKPENVAISCDPLRTRLLFIDLDGLLTLRSVDGTRPFHRRDLLQSGDVPIATYAPLELAIDADPSPTYNEEQTVLLSTYAFTCTLLDLVNCAVGTPMVDATALRQATAAGGYASILRPALEQTATELNRIVLASEHANTNAAGLHTLVSEIDGVLSYLTSGSMVSPGPETTSPDDVYLYALRCATVFSDSLGPGAEATTTAITHHTA